MAANKRVSAIETVGPAKQSRLRDSAAQLEQAAAALTHKKQARVRETAFRLSQCSQRDEAVRLRDELIALSGG